MEIVISPNGKSPAEVNLRGFYYVTLTNITLLTKVKKV
jgi:hypothetical protein